MIGSRMYWATLRLKMANDDGFDSVTVIKANKNDGISPKKG